MPYMDVIWQKRIILFCMWNRVIYVPERGAENEMNSKHNANEVQPIWRTEAVIVVIIAPQRGKGEGYLEM